MNLYDRKYVKPILFLLIRFSFLYLKEDEISSPMASINTYVFPIKLYHVRQSNHKIV